MCLTILWGLAIKGLKTRATLDISQILVVKKILLEAFRTLGRKLRGFFTKIKKLRCQPKILKQRTRNWGNEETSSFVDILTDEEHNFADFLETRALKCSVNEEVYRNIL